jgi:hypothetical protein
MIQKTVINTGCNLIINSTPDKFDSPIEPEDEGPQEPQDAQYEVIDDSADEAQVIDEQAATQPEASDSAAKEQNKAEDEDF